MRFLQKLSTLVSPKKAEFAKRLASKRLTCASSPFSAGIGEEGSAGYQLRVFGLGSIEYAFTPEATIVNILEHYWAPALQHMWGAAPNVSKLETEQARISAMEKLNHHIGAIEYRLTKQPDAAVYLPEFCSLTEYMRHRIKIEHPNDSHLSAQDGFTEDFFAYAIEESRFVFGRGTHSGYI